MRNNNAVREFYENRYDEDRRFADNPLEFIRSQEIIARYVTKSRLAVADIAGATGRYSYWLAEQGHEVHLLDLSARHIELAKIHGKKRGIELASLTCGDARQLPYEDDSFDMVLLMGALYHLQESGNRIQCLNECRRVLKPGGRAVFAYISRYASLVDGYKYQFIDDTKFQRIVETDLRTGKHENPEGIPHYFTTAFFHTPQLIAEEVRQGGFQNIRLFAVEGFASLINTDDMMRDEGKKELLLQHLRLLENTQELLGISSHILATCTKV